MIYGLYISAAGRDGEQPSQDVISNNLANSETIGFKRDLAMFMEHPPSRNRRSSQTRTRTDCSTRSAAACWLRRR
jgi:flagellar basal body rod protein FlgG